MHVRVVASLFLLCLLFAGCGEGKNAQVNSETPVILEAGTPSGLFQVPLPEGAVKTPAAPGAEAYRAKKADTLGDLQAFYDKQMAGKPFRGYEWCGGTSDVNNTKAVIIWQKANTNDLFRLAMDTTDTAGILIVMTEEKNAAPTQCPPGPLDSIPNYDPGDIPGV